MPRLLPCLALCLLAAPALADEAEDAFVEANVLSIFYHEMGHALIDLMGLPVFGQEEDAADVASVILTDYLWEPDAALAIAYDASFGFAAEAMMGAQEGYDIAWWDVHGPDEQRFYNTVCLFYGADPEARDDFAEDMGLPEDRAETCEEEFELAAGSWVPVLEEMAEMQGARMVFDPAGNLPWLDDLLAAEVADLNDRFSWPQPLTVATGPCGEANAFYFPDEALIQVCDEMVPYLHELFVLSEQ